MDQLEVEIRKAFFPVWRVTTKMGSVAALFVIGGLTMAGEQDPLLVLVEVLSPFVLGVLTPVTVRLFPAVYLTPIGIRCTERWGSYRLSRWEVIDNVRPITWVGLRYLQFRNSDNRRRFVFPLFLADVAGFAEAVALLTGPEHPLAQALACEAT
jgi:hypothetical protein